jgi:selenocysteine lyase/cysteine desulfurase
MIERVFREEAHRAAEGRLADGAGAAGAAIDLRLLQRMGDEERRRRVMQILRVTEGIPSKVTLYWPS